MQKNPVDLRQHEFIGVVLPDPNKEGNGNLFGNIINGGLFGGLGGSGLNNVFGGLTNSIYSNLAGNANSALGLGGISDILQGNVSNNPLTNVVSSGFGNILNNNNLIASSVSMGLSSMSGGSFLNFGGALLGLTQGTPALKGLANSFNVISQITNGFGALNSFSIGYDSSIIRDVGVLGMFAGKINSTIPNGIANTLINSIGLNLQDLTIFNEINGFISDIGDGISSTVQDLFNGGSSYNIGDIYKFNGMNSIGADISSVKQLGSAIKNEPEGNIKVYVHIPELMYQIEQVKGIWCFNRLATVNRNSSSNNSGLLGSLSKSIANYAAGYVSGGGSYGSGLASMFNSGNVDSKNSTSVVSSIGDTIGGMISGEQDKGSGSSGKYEPLHPGTKVFIKFTENDFNTGQIVGLAHEEIDDQNELVPNNFNPSLLKNNEKNTVSLVSTSKQLLSNIGSLDSDVNSVKKELETISLFSDSLSSSSEMIVNINYDNLNFSNFFNSTSDSESDISNLEEYYSNYGSR